MHLCNECDKNTRLGKVIQKSGCRPDSLGSNPWRSVPMKTELPKQIVRLDEFRYDKASEKTKEQELMPFLAWVNKNQAKEATREVPLRQFAGVCVDGCMSRKNSRSIGAFARADCSIAETCAVMGVRAERERKFTSASNETRALLVPR